MRRKNGTRALLTALALTLCLGLAAAPLWVGAANGGGGDGSIQMTVSYHPGDTSPSTPEGQEGTKGFRLYRVAEISQDGSSFVLAEDFKNLMGTHIATTMTPYNVFETIDWDLVETVGAYINRNVPEPSFIAPLRDGEAVFTGLPQGLYLGTGPSCVVDGKLQTPAPFLVCLPYLVSDGETTVPGFDGQTDVAYTNITVTLKFSAPQTPDNPGPDKPKPTPPTPDTPTPDTPTPDNPTPTPANPTPTPDLPEIDIPDEPVPLVDIPDEPVPLVDIPDEPTPQIDLPDEPVPLQPGSPPGEKTPTTEIPDGLVPLAMLPQTGLLWWPVPVMGACGAVLVAVGAVGRRRAE